MNDAIEVRTALLGMGWKWAAALPTDAAILARIYGGIRAAYMAMPESVNVDGGTRKQRRYSTAEAFDDAVTAFAAEQHVTYGGLRLYRAMGDARARWRDLEREPQGNGRNSFPAVAPVGSCGGLRSRTLRSVGCRANFARPNTDRQPPILLAKSASRKLRAVWQPPCATRVVAASSA